MSSQVSISPEDVLVRATATPNPYAFKFIVNQAIKNEGKATFHSAAECGHIPLAESLFHIPGIKQVYFFKNTITITHDGELEEDELIDQVTSVIRTRVPIHDANFIFGEEVQNKRVDIQRAPRTPEIDQIEEILDRTIRPGLQADGGDIDVISLEENVLKVLYQGACGGCPSAMMGTLDAIQGILRQELENEALLVVPL